MLDLKRFFLNQPTLLEKTYNNRETRLWLNSFLSFQDFIQKMKLNLFITDNFDILNIVTMEPMNDSINLKEFAQKTKDNKIMRTYIINAIQLANSQK